MKNSFKKSLVIIFTSFVLPLSVFAQDSLTIPANFDFGNWQNIIHRLPSGTLRPDTIQKLEIFGKRLNDQAKNNINASPTPLSGLLNNAQPQNQQQNQAMQMLKSILPGLMGGFGSGGNKSAQQPHSNNSQPAPGNNTGNPPPGNNQDTPPPPAKNNDDKNKVEDLQKKYDECVKDAGKDKKKLKECDKIKEELDKVKEKDKDKDDADGKGGKFLELLNEKCNVLADEKNKVLASSDDYFLAKAENQKSKKTFYLAYKKSYLPSVDISVVKIALKGKCYTANDVKKLGVIKYCCKDDKCVSKTELSGNLFTTTTKVPDDSIVDCK
jgi:hypothetical protein